MNPIAVHEAAHAVIAIDYDVWFEHVELTDDNGRVFNDPNALDLTTSDPPTERDVDDVRKRVAVILAGPIADARTGADDNDRRRFKQHRAQALEKVRTHRIPEPDSLVESVWRETESRVGESWPRIMRVATELVAKRSLTRDDVEAILL